MIITEISFISYIGIELIFSAEDAETQLGISSIVAPITSDAISHWAIAECQFGEQDFSKAVKQTC